MANIKDDYVFKLKGGEASTLECVNPFLERREPIVVFFENGRTNIKIGDGKNNYNSLPFISDTNIDINDVQGLAEILHQYEIDLENLDDKIDKIVIDKVYDPNSDNAQSGKAVAEAIETTVGRKTAEGGEIFNDYDNEASGQFSHAQGTGTKAKHKSSSTSGLNTETGTDNQTVVGKYNRVVSDALFVVGNGTDNDSRKNAFEVKANGDVKIDSALILTDSTSGKEYKIYINDGKLQLEEVN